MKTIGLLGGMSWESTLSYYRKINEGVRETLGDLHSAKIALYSVDFEPIEKMQHAGDWEATARALSEAAKRVEAAGADFLLLCTNTMHKVAPEIESSISIPLLHIADASAEVLVINQTDSGVKLFDTTAIHADKAVEYATKTETSVACESRSIKMMTMYVKS